MSDGYKILLDVQINCNMLRMVIGDTLLFSSFQIRLIKSRVYWL